MADVNKLSMSVKTRAENETAAHIRAEKYIPVELYGNHVENKHLKVRVLDFENIFAQAGESVLVEVVIDEDKTATVLIKEVQLNPTKDTVMHADLYQIKEGETLTTEIPLVFVGTAPAVKELGGILVKNIDGIEVECLPKDLVHDIQVDVGSLVDFTSAILVGDLQIPHGMTVLTDSQVAVAQVSEPRKAAEEESAPAEQEAEAIAKENKAAEAKTEGSQE